MRNASAAAPISSRAARATRSCRRARKPTTRGRIPKWRLRPASAYAAWMRRLRSASAAAAPSPRSPLGQASARPNAPRSFAVFGPPRHVRTKSEEPPPRAASRAVVAPARVPPSRVGRHHLRDRSARLARMSFRDARGWPGSNLIRVSASRSRTAPTVSDTGTARTRRPSSGCSAGTNEATAATAIAHAPPKRKRAASVTPPAKLYPIRLAALPGSLLLLRLLLRCHRSTPFPRIATRTVPCRASRDWAGNDVATFRSTRRIGVRITGHAPDSVLAPHLCAEKVKNSMKKSSSGHGHRGAGHDPSSIYFR